MPSRLSDCSSRLSCVCPFSTTGASEFTHANASSCPHIMCVLAFSGQQALLETVLACKHGMLPTPHSDQPFAFFLLKNCCQSSSQLLKVCKVAHARRITQCSMFCAVLHILLSDVIRGDSTALLLADRIFHEGG